MDNNKNQDEGTDKHKSLILQPLHPQEFNKDDKKEAPQYTPPLPEAKTPNIIPQPSQDFSQADPSFNSERTNIKTPWIKIGLLGLALPLLIVLISSIFLFSANKIGLKSLDAYVLVARLLIVLLIIFVFLIAKLLRKWSLESPIATSVGTVLFLFFSIDLVEHLQQNNLINLQSGTSNKATDLISSVPGDIAIPIISLVGIIGITIIFERLYKLKYRFRFVLATAFVCLPLVINLALPKSYDAFSTNESSDKVKQIGPASTDPTDFEKKLTKEQLAVLNTIPYGLYLPASQQISSPILSYSEASPEKLVLSYSVNPQYGSGLVKGSYGYSVYPAKGSYYNPPNDCGFAGHSKTSSPIKCSLYQGSSKDLPAYVYNGGSPGGITYVGADGQGAQKITMYAQLDDMVVRVETSDTDPSELYQLVQSMDKIQPRQLPATTTIFFSKN